VKPIFFNHVIMSVSNMIQQAFDECVFVHLSLCVLCFEQSVDHKTKHLNIIFVKTQKKSDSMKVLLYCYTDLNNLHYKLSEFHFPFLAI